VTTSEPQPLALRRGRRDARAYAVLAAGLVVAGSSIRTAAADEMQREHRGDIAAAAVGLIPGLGQIYLGRPKSGAAYGGLTVALGAAGWWLNGRSFGTLTTPASLKAALGVQFLLHAEKTVWFASIYDAYSSKRPSRLSLDELIAAPFSPRRMRHPFVWAGAIVLGLATFAEAQGLGGPINPIWTARKIQIGSLTTDALTAGIVSTGFSASANIAHAAGEEALFRGVIQDELVVQLGVPAAIAITSAGFGLAHLGSAAKYDLKGVAAVVVPRTIAGVYFGTGYEATGDLGISVATHFWVNMSSEIAQMLLVRDGSYYISLQSAF